MRSPAKITDDRIGLAPGELDRDEKRNDTNHRVRTTPDQGGSNGHVGVSACQANHQNRDQEGRGAPEAGSEPAKPAHQGVGAGVRTREPLHGLAGRSQEGVVEATFSQASR